MATTNDARSTAPRGVAPARFESPLLDLIAGDGLHAAFQPIVDLRTQAVVGYEALARGPQGTELERPDRLFAEARRSSLVADLDAAVHRRALAAAADAGLGHPATLF